MAQCHLLSKFLTENQRGNYETGIEALSKYIDSFSNKAEEEYKAAIRLRIETNLKVGKIDEVKRDIMLLNSIPADQKDKQILLEMIRMSL
ncbi:unnamed protein product [Rotaria sp. Silwood2]|nr:unnamed protein product [Rotaria sp. Silwood2]CAF4390067.1 unnamed protein product [Rotaria sp. Silwood2]CAF4525400.1 unnamed protein product [Rotaria sp. Silwood2]